MISFPNPGWYPVVYHRVPSWVHCFSQLIYVNDMETAVKCKLILYGDDSALLVSGKYSKVIQETLGKELCALSSWLVDNKLSLLLGKTESILFGSCKKICNSPSLDNKCGDTNISSKKSVRYLGVDLEQTISGILILENILKKGNSRLKFLRRQAKCLNLASKKLLSSALIQCHMDYACSSWYHGLQKNLKHKLQILQNKTIRFVLDLTPRSIGYSEFNRVNWLPVRFRVQQIVSTNMHRLIQGNAPLCLREGISRVQERHSYNTRNSVLSLVLPRVNSSGDKSFSYIAAKFRNQLPIPIRATENPLHFRSLIKKHFMSLVKTEEENIFI